MNVTIHPDGRIEVVGAILEQVVEIGSKLTARGSMTNGAPRAKKKCNRATEEGVTELNESQQHAWTWLVANAQFGAVTPAVYAQGTGINSTTASARFAKLARMGLAHRQPGGTYKLGPDPERK